MSLVKFVPAQIQTARDTYARVVDLGLSDYVAELAICCQIVESSLLGPIWYGDNTVTKGAFQQKDAWVRQGVLNQPQDPRRTMAGGLFLFLYGGAAGQEGILDKRWWPPASMTGSARAQGVGALIQSVQLSNLPGKYTVAQPDAAALVQAVR